MMLHRKRAHPLGNHRSRRSAAKAALVNVLLSASTGQ